MPLYEYRCRHCGQQFEVLIRDATAPSCRACGSDALERLSSLFGVATEASRQSSIQKARKEGQKIRRDKAVAEREAIEHHDH